MNTSYMKNTDINAIAKTVRQQLKSEFPDWNFSVTLKKYSGGRSMKIALMSGPEPVVAQYKSYRSAPDGEWIEGTTGYHQLNYYAFRDGEETYTPHGPMKHITNGTQLTPCAWKMFSRVVEIAQGENWDNSDSMIDYCDVNYYLHLDIGKFDKHYVATGDANPAPVTTPTWVKHNLDILQYASS